MRYRGNNTTRVLRHVCSAPICPPALRPPQPHVPGHKHVQKPSYCDQTSGPNSGYANQNRSQSCHCTPFRVHSRNVNLQS